MAKPGGTAGPQKWNPLPGRRELLVAGGPGRGFPFLSCAGRPKARVSTSFAGTGAIEPGCNGVHGGAVSPSPPRRTEMVDEVTMIPRAKAGSSRTPYRGHSKPLPPSLGAGQWIIEDWIFLTIAETGAPRTGVCPLSGAAMDGPQTRNGSGGGRQPAQLPHLVPLGLGTLPPPVIARRDDLSVVQTAQSRLRLRRQPSTIVDFFHLTTLPQACLSR